MFAIPLIGATKRSAVGSQAGNMKKDSLPGKMIIGTPSNRRRESHEYSTTSYHKFVDMERDRT